MQVSLVDFTGKCHANPAAYAAAMLIFAKSTRLEMSPKVFERALSLSPEERLKELEYIANTIPSSWEFVDLTFMIEGVTRAFTHQFVRSRHASFAQQTMRVLDVSEGPGWSFGTGPTIEGDSHRRSSFNSIMGMIATQYKFLIRDGAAIEDARGILPTNILTNILVKMNLRTFVETVRKRSSPRVQGEYRAVLEAMKSAAIAELPWATLFIERDFERAARDLDDEIAALPDRAAATRMLKLVDQMRAQS